MTSKEKIKAEINSCINKGSLIIIWLRSEEEYVKLTKKKEEKEKKANFSFHHEYQKWYSLSLKIIQNLAPDRYKEFVSYYEIDPKRKALGYGNYVIQDYLKNIIPNRNNYPGFDSREQTLQCLYNQYTILTSINNRIDNVLNDIQVTLYVELQDNEIETAKNLLKINLRAAGVIAGVILESYLHKLIENHKFTISKKNPTISDFNELLKSNQIIDTTVWRKISYLGDIRNICAHNKNIEPKKEQVEELIEGVEWATKNIF